MRDAETLWLEVLELDTDDARRAWWNQCTPEERKLINKTTQDVVQAIIKRKAKEAVAQASDVLGNLGRQEWANLLGPIDMTADRSDT